MTIQFGSNPDADFLNPADFGTVAGQNTVAEVKDLITLWDTRVQQMTNGYNKIGKDWMTSNPSEHQDWFNDYQAMLTRYNTAKSDAQKSMSDDSWNPLPDSMIPLQNGYDNISKAMQQNYPPDGATQAKGDWKDLFQRLNNAGVEVAGYKSAQGGQGSLVVDNPSQPVATDVDQQIIQKTSPVQLIVNNWLNIVKWIETHPKTMIAIGVVVIGGIAYPYIKLITAPIRAVVGA